MRFEGKRVLITGAASGIGLAGARRIAAEGGDLVLTDVDQERIAAAQEALPKAQIAVNDAGDPDAADDLARTVASGRGLDGLWLNAGYGAVAAVDQIDAAFFDRMMSVNVRGPVLQLARLTKHLNAGAAVLVTSSAATYEGAAAASVYAATKGALLAAARGWATALADRRVRVNVLVPGAIRSGFRSFMSQERQDSFEQDVVRRVPLGRVGTAEEAAAVALFLLSDDAAYVTASQYSVDGGLTKW